ncbi:MAG TPA: argininosuccinate lyase [Spirochaetia bacterium]|nr:argininosuccinate lyase [Spirochaetia bacterium]
MTKLWGGRFQKETDAQMASFHSSLSFDRRMIFQDLRGSMAHARMLGETGIISREEAGALVTGLAQLAEDLTGGRTDLPAGAEDVHSAVEQLLTERLGEVAGKLHTGRSRNDQVALDLRLYLKEEITRISSLLGELAGQLLNLAEEHVGTVVPGYTHLQRAQPVTLAHHLLAYGEMFFRDMERFADCYRRTDVLPLGAGALAGSGFPLDRHLVARELGFARVSENSMDAVADRDFVVEFTFCASLAMVHLSRLGEELVLWSTSEFSFIEMDDAFATGSSMMPQKKNPDAAELVRGKTGRVCGDLMGLLTVLKGLPLTYNKDLQEDKEAVFDAADTLGACLPVMTGMLGSLRVKSGVMRRAAGEGFTNATDLADYLAGRGVPFRTAHELTGQIVLYALEGHKTLEELSLAELRRFWPGFDEAVYARINVEECVRVRQVYGGPAPERVREALDRARTRLAALTGPQAKE